MYSVVKLVTVRGFFFQEKRRKMRGTTKKNPGTRSKMNPECFYKFKYVYFILFLFSDSMSIGSIRKSSMVWCKKCIQSNNFYHFPFVSISYSKRRLLRYFKTFLDGKQVTVTYLLIGIRRNGYRYSPFIGFRNITE